MTPEMPENIRDILSKIDEGDRQMFQFAVIIRALEQSSLAVDIKTDITKKQLELAQRAVRLDFVVDVLEKLEKLIPAAQKNDLTATQALRHLLDQLARSALKTTEEYAKLENQLRTMLEAFNLITKETSNG